MRQILKMEAIKSLETVRFFKYRQAVVQFDPNDLHERCLAYSDMEGDTETADALVWAMFGEETENLISAIVKTPEGEELALRWSDGCLYIGPGVIVAGDHAFSGFGGPSGTLWRYKCLKCAEYHHSGLCHTQSNNH